MAHTIKPDMNTRNRMPATSCRLIANFAYGPHERQELDLYVPQSVDVPAPLIINIHGGGWSAGDRGRLAGEALWVQEGFAVARINYRYSTQASHPAQIEDCRSALAALRERADGFGLSSGPCCVIGHSAGGHLASLLGCTTPGVCAVVNQAGPVDLYHLGTARSGVTDDGREAQGAIDTLLGCRVPDAPEAARAASPINQIDANTPPHLLIFAEDDAIVPKSEGDSFLAAMRAADRPCELVTFTGGHCSPAFWQEENLRRVVAFFRSALARA